MNLELAGKRALVTGASKGIGFASALQLAEEGCDLVLVSRDVAMLEAAAARVRSTHGTRVDAIAADLSESGGIARVAGVLGEIDILVNNAGAIPPGTLLDVDEAAWREAWDLKVFGYVNLTRALYERLRARGGVVVNVIGTAGEVFDGNYIAGSAANASLMAFTRALGKTAVKDGMRVVGINPGPVATERIEMLLRARAKRDLGDESRWRSFHEAMPLGRPAAAAEIANAVAFLASPRSAYTNGTVLTIDGGPS